MVQVYAIYRAYTFNPRYLTARACYVQYTHVASERLGQPLQKLIVSFAAAIALVAVQLPSNAATVKTLDPGQLTDTNASDGLDGGLADFNSPASLTSYNGTLVAQGDFTVGTASFSGDAIFMKNDGQDALGLYAEPYHDTTQYLSVQPLGSTETVAFTGAYKVLGLYWGSMDTYNSIAFYLNNVLVDTVDGAQAAAAVIPPPGGTTAVGAQADDLNNRYVVISNVGGGGGFNKVVLTSTQNSFEIDNLAWGSLVTTGAPPSPAPLPAALPLFGTVVGGGLFLRKLLSRRRARA